MEVVQNPIKNCGNSMGDHENIAVEIPWGGLLIKQYSGISMGMGQTDMWNFHGGGSKIKKPAEIPWGGGG